MPEATATPQPERQLSGFRLIRLLQNLPAEVLERPVTTYVEAGRGTGGKGRWIPVVGVTSTAVHVEIALEDEE